MTTGLMCFDTAVEPGYIGNLYQATNFYRVFLHGGRELRDDRQGVWAAVSPVQESARFL